MCMKQPGPRCSRHLSEQLQRAVATQNQTAERRIALSDKTARINEFLDIASDPDERRVLRDELREAENELVRAAQKDDDAQMTYWAALDEYDESPEGQRKINEEINASLDASNEARVERLKSRLEAAQSRRHMKVLQYKAVYNEDPDDSVPSIADTAMITQSLSRDEKVYVAYKGSIKEAHGIYEVVAANPDPRGGTFSLRLPDGRYLDHVRAKSIRLIND